MRTDPQWLSYVQSGRVNADACASCRTTNAQVMRYWVTELPRPADPLAALSCLYRRSDHEAIYMPPSGTVRRPEYDRILEVRLEMLARQLSPPWAHTARPGRAYRRHCLRRGRTGPADRRNRNGRPGKYRVCGRLPADDRTAQVWRHAVSRWRKFPASNRWSLARRMAAGECGWWRPDRGSRPPARFRSVRPSAFPCPSIARCRRVQRVAKLRRTQPGGSGRNEPGTGRRPVARFGRSRCQISTRVIARGSGIAAHRPRRTHRSPARAGAAWSNR